MAGAAKITGTLLSLAGLLLLSLYKGVPLTHQASAALSPEAAHHAAAEGSGNKSWMLGTVALLANCLCFSFWLLLQTRLTKKYPAIYSSTALMFFISTLQGGALTAAMERHVSLWILTSKLEIITVLYAVRYKHHHLLHLEFYTHTKWNLSVQKEQILIKNIYLILQLTH